MNDFCREKEALSVKFNELKAELSAITTQRDELEKCNLETSLQVLVTNCGKCVIIILHCNLMLCVFLLLCC